MMTPSKTTAILALAVMAAGVDAHGKLTLPAPTCTGGYCSNSPSGTIDGPSTIPVPSGMSYGTDPDSNAKAFLTGFKASKYKSLKELATSAAVKTEAGATKECGYANANGPAQALPDAVQWDKFDLSHTGPCEVWCDDVMAFQDDNCSVNMKTQPAVLKYDKSKCAGKKMLSSYWIAVHVPTWQIYTYCTPISGGGASSGGGGGSAATPPASGGNNNNGGGNNNATPKPASTTKAPSTGGNNNNKTPAPAGNEADEDCEDELPIAGEEDCDDELDIADTPKPASGGEVGYEADDEDCELPVAGDEDCDRDLDIAGDDIGTSDLNFDILKEGDDVAASVYA